MKTEIIVIGGGFAGLAACQKLIKKDQSVLLINKTDYFTFTPLLHELATGNLDLSDVVFKYSELIRSKKFGFIKGELKNIDTNSKKIILTDGQSYKYDQLILATGFKPNLDIIEGAQFALTLDNIDSALKFKHTIASVVANEKKHININVIGGGATAIELVLELTQVLRDFLKEIPGLSYKISLFSSTLKLSPNFSDKVSDYAKSILTNAGIDLHLAEPVKKIDKKNIYTNKGSYHNDQAILLAGIKPRADYLADQLLDSRGFVRTNDFLQLEGFDDIWAIGDIVRPTEPKLAQLAQLQGRLVAINIVNCISGKSLKVYKPKLKGLLLSLGYGRAIGQFGIITIKGLLAWFIWRTVYLFKIPGVKNKLRIAVSWTLHLFSNRKKEE